MNKKHWFGFNIFVLMFSSAGILFFHLSAIAAPFIIMPGVSKELMILGIGIGYGIAVGLAIISIHGLWSASKFITILPQKEASLIEPTKTDLNKEENNKI